MSSSKKTIDIAFVILHYISIVDTEETIKSVKKNIDTQSYHIVVVDNGSPNGTGNVLKENYKNDEQVTVVISEKNLGFACGNNLGINYVRKCFAFTFLAVLNNDIYLLEKNLVEKLYKEYDKSKFAVLGPMILTAEGKCNINPGRKQVISKREVMHKITRYKRQIFFGKIYMGRVYELLLKLYHNYIYLPGRLADGEKKNKIYINREEMVQLHGCFLIFTNEFFEKLPGFDERTFLYMEEDILFAQIVKNKLLSVYLPDIQVFHNEDQATNKVSKENERKKKLFMRNNYVNSAKVLMGVLDEMDDVINHRG